MSLALVMVGVMITIGAFMFYKMKSGGGSIFGSNNAPAPQLNTVLSSPSSISSTPNLPGPSGVPTFGSKEEVKAYSEVELKKVGFGDDDIDDFYRWLDKQDPDKTAQTDVTNWLLDRARKLGLIN